jgi:large subunit ribosomal protein L22
MIATAKLQYLGVSAQKVRLVVDQVRGKPVEEAIGILHYCPKRVAGKLEKLLKSAVANAQQKDPELDVDRLLIAKALVNEAPTMRRARNRAMGRIFPILKRACHVQFDLDVSRSAAQGG